jgi:outer membrane receptor protein involved in Fe transport
MLLFRIFLLFLAVTVCVLGAAAQEPKPQSTVAPSPTPGQIREEVIVTASRTETRIGETPASVATLGRADIAAAAAPVLDDVLRQTVGFSIFRRSSSRNANPTTQGVSLRGLGASGASRSVILFDGVPLNDPFGGWVQWGRVAPIEVERVEVLRGGASSLYGDGGLSGAVNVIPRKDEGRWLSADLFGGTQTTLAGSGTGGAAFGKWLTSLTAASFHTRGFKPVDEAARGPVDSYAGVRSNNFAARITRDLGDAGAVFFRPSYFGEVRTNGTGLQTNRTHIRQFVLGGGHGADGGGTAGGKGPFNGLRLMWRAFGGTQVFDQMFSAVNAARTSESLTRVQRVPVQTIGATVQTSYILGDHTLVGGVEARNVRGASDEIAYANNVSTALIGSGGRQTTVGAFFQDLVRVGGKLVLAGSVRFDGWQNYAASSVTHTLATNQTAVAAFPDRTENAVSPQGSALYHLTDQWSLYGSAGRSFRAPTLNELYRAFRVGNVLTLANENLQAERAKTLEGGVSFGRARTFIRASGFWTVVDLPVANVTLTTTPTLITRQRQNAGATRSRGFEIEAETRIDRLSLSAGYLFADSRVTSFPANPAVEGLKVPQVAKHQATFSVRFSSGKWTYSIQGRASGEQYDDDLNLFRLEPYFQVDTFVSKRISEKASVYLAVENVLNSRYSVGKTPIRTVSSPANLRIGFRWN